jgi:hypothetical protein
LTNSRARAEKIEDEPGAGNKEIFKALYKAKSIRAH